MTSWLQMRRPRTQETQLRPRIHHVRQDGIYSSCGQQEADPPCLSSLPPPSDSHPNASPSIPCCLLSWASLSLSSRLSTFLFSTGPLQPECQRRLTEGPHFLLPHRLARWIPCGATMCTELQEAVKCRVLMCLFLCLQHPTNTWPIGNP